MSGSTVVSLKAEYLNTLSVGTHKLTFVYDGKDRCETNFTIKKASSGQPETPKDNNKTNKKSTTPKTGDNNNMILWIVLLLASCSAVVGPIIYGRKKKHSGK